MDTMALWFVPAPQADASALAAAGLDKLFAPAEMTRAEVRSGPGGAAGVICSPQVGGGVRYEPARQTWADCGGYWFGWWTDAPPMPEDLERPTMLPRGNDVPLGDGNVWTVPTPELQPQRLQLDAHGVWTPQRDQRLADLFTLADKLLKQYWEPIDPISQSTAQLARQLREAGEMVDEALAREATAAIERWREAVATLPLQTLCDVLAVNYRVSANEVSALGLFRCEGQQGASMDAWQLLDAFVDGLNIRIARRGKKKLPGG